MPKYLLEITMQEEPKICDDCQFDYDGICCVAVSDCKHHEVNTLKAKESWCPLRENQTSAQFMQLMK